MMIFRQPFPQLHASHSCACRDHDAHMWGLAHGHACEQTPPHKHNDRICTSFGSMVQTRRQNAIYMSATPSCGCPLDLSTQLVCQLLPLLDVHLISPPNLYISFISPPFFSMGQAQAPMSTDPTSIVSALSSSHILGLHVSVSFSLYISLLQSLVVFTSLTSVNLGCVLWVYICILTSRCCPPDLLCSFCLTCHPQITSINFWCLLWVYIYIFISNNCPLDLLCSFYLSCVKSTCVLMSMQGSH